MKLKEYLLLNLVNPLKEEKGLLENGFVVISESVDNDVMMLDFKKSEYHTDTRFGLVADDEVIAACKSLDKKLVIYSKEKRNV